MSAKRRPLHSSSTEQEMFRFLQEIEEKVTDIQSRVQKANDHARVETYLPKQEAERSSFGCNSGVAEVTFDMLPSSLAEMGITTLGSKDSLIHLLQSAAPPATVSIGGTTLCMLSDLSDDSIARLGAEFPPDSGVYGAKELPRDSIGTVIDVGANLGAFTIYTALLHPQMRVISFEPTPPTYFFFVCNLFLNKVKLLSLNGPGFPWKPGVLPLHGAVGAVEGTVVISWDPSKTQNAAADSDEPSVKAQGWNKKTVVRYPIRRVLEGPWVVKIFKIDCEGCEFSVIPALADFLPNRTKIEKLVGEYHLSLLNKNEDTFAKKPSAEAAARTKKIILARGCMQAWQIDC